MQNLFWKIFPVAVGLPIPLVSKHLQLIPIEQLIGNFQNSSMRPMRRKGKNKRVVKSLTSEKARVKTEVKTEKHTCSFAEVLWHSGSQSVQSPHLTDTKRYPASVARAEKPLKNTTVVENGEFAAEAAVQVIILHFNSVSLVSCRHV